MNIILLNYIIYYYNIILSYFNKNDKNNSINYKQKVNNKLHTFISKPSELIELLDNNNIISGSSILQILNNENYLNSDIDLYVHSDKYAKFKQILIKNLYFISNNYSNYSNKNVIIFQKIINNKILTIDITITNKAIYIIKNFDLKIVRNYFNGTEIIILNKQEIKNKKEIITSSDITNFHSKHTYIRIQKYMKRGYIFEFKQ